MQYVKLFEEFKFGNTGKHNIYALMGQNLQNYMTAKQQEFARNKFFDNNFLKELHLLTPVEKAKSLNVNDVNKYINYLFKELLKKVEEAKETADFKLIHDLHYKFMSFFTLAFKLDTVKVSRFIRNDKWFDFYKLDEIKDFKEQETNIIKKWQKISNNDAQIKNLLITDLNTGLKNWLSVFKDERVLKLRDFTKYTIKADEQQTEAENNINNFTTKISDADLKKVEQTNTSAAEKIKHLGEQVGFDEAFLKRFDQPGLPNSNKMMKKWFLEAFKKAEEIYGKSFTITSGIRTEEYQKLLTARGYKTAKKNSPHIEGVAADISITNLDVNKVIEAFEKAGFTRFGIGKSFLHVDLGDQLNPKIWVPYARWTYTY